MTTPPTTDLAPIVAFIERMLQADEDEARGAAGWRRDGKTRANGRWSRYGMASIDDDDGQSVIYSDNNQVAGQVAAHIARHDPARVLAQVAALKDVVDLHHPYDHRGEHGDYVFCTVCQWDHGDDSPRVDMGMDEFGKPCPTLRHIAAIWRGVEGWREEWAS